MSLLILWLLFHKQIKGSSYPVKYVSTSTCWIHTIFRSYVIGPPESQYYYSVEYTVQWKKQKAPLVFN